MSDGLRRRRRGRATGEKDTHEFVAYFQKELEGKDVRLHSLSELLAQQDAERSAERELLTQRQSEHLAAVEAQQGSFEREKNDKILQLEDELAKVETFREMKREMDTKIEQLERAPARVRNFTRAQSRSWKRDARSGKDHALLADFARLP